MATVAQLIEALQKLPQNAEVECGREVTRNWETFMEYAPVDAEYFSVIDYSSEEDRVKYPYMAGRIIVKIFAES